MKTLKGIFLVATLLCLAGEAGAQGQGDNHKRKSWTEQKMDLEKAYLKSGKIIKKNGSFVMAPDTSTVSVKKHVHQNPTGVETSVNSQIREIVKPFTPDQWKRIPGQDKMLLRSGNDIEMLDLATGKREQELSFNNKKSFQPLLVSPDGKLMIFFDKGATYLYSFANKTKELLLPHDKGRSFAWSPDCKQIVYEHEKSVWVIAINTKVAKNITEKWYEYPSWSVKGDRVKVLKLGDRDHYWLINPSNSKSEQFPLTIEGDVSFPNDNSKWLILRSEEIYIKDLTTKQEIKIGNRANDNPAKAIGWGVPEISPDGTKVAYIYWEFECDDWEPSSKCPNVARDVFVYDSKTSKTVDVSNTPDRMEQWTFWSMDGKSIFSLSYAGENDKMPTFVEIKLN